MTRTPLSEVLTYTARKLARDGVSIMRISTVIGAPYADVFAAVRGLDNPRPVLGEQPLRGNETKGGDPWT